MNERSENRAEHQRWQSLLNSWAEKREQPLRAITFRKGWKTNAQPVLIACEDGNEYVIKGQQAGRQIVNDQIIARLGETMGAPVGKPKLVEVSVELIGIERRLSHLSPGIAHGTQFIPDCFDNPEVLGSDSPENRSRIAKLAVLYAWIQANDSQFLFTNARRLIHSVDHGHFFPGGPNWDEQKLLSAPCVELPACFADCYLTPLELQGALQALEAVTEAKIIQAVASPPDQWGLTIRERVVLVEYLTRRRQELLRQSLNKSQ